MKQVVILVLIAALAGCGGKRSGKAGKAVPRAAPVAFGPISKACLKSDREAKSRQLCGCIQAVANDTLTRSQQRQAVQFYRDPAMAQKIRQSDRPSDEKFWRAYKAYGEKARQVCG